MYSFFKKNRRVLLQKFSKNSQNTSLVLLIIGQSNAANYVDVKTNTKLPIFTFHNRNIYKAKEPLKGSSGNKGSLWVLLSEKILKSKLADEVLLVPIAQSSTSVLDWQPDNVQGNLLLNTLKKLKRHQLKLNYVFWIQGEQDNLKNTSTYVYVENFKKIMKIIESNYKNTIFLTTLTSYHPFSNQPKNENIRKAQKILANSNENVRLVVDTDCYISESYRYDGIHFSYKAAEQITNDIINTLIKDNILIT